MRETFVFKLGVKKVNWTYTFIETDTDFLTIHILPLYLNNPEVKAISIQKVEDSSNE